jgi:hypothetical protein
VEIIGRRPAILGNVTGNPEESRKLHPESELQKVMQRKAIRGWVKNLSTGYFLTMRWLIFNHFNPDFPVATGQKVTSGDNFTG